MALLPEECRPEDWIPDEEVSRCPKCRQEFSFFNRRHHCRFCGGVFNGEPCSFVLGEDYAASYRNKRICIYCHALFFKHCNLLQEGDTFLKYSQDAKSKTEKHFWITTFRGEITISWTDPGKKRSLSFKSDDSRCFILADSNKVESIEHPPTVREPRKLIIKIESKERSLVLETTNAQQHSQWLEGMQAAHYVSKALLLKQQRKRAAEEAAAAEAQAEVKVARRAERDERTARREGLRQKWASKNGQ
eukprot:m.16682 g.16682  ORF g.16682 m.16682 type:complete len:247 (+) comp27067_c1_seq1:44-784(+)